jgi:hypothetical protein
MAAQQFFIFSTSGLCALRHTESVAFNGGHIYDWEYRIKSL